MITSIARRGTKTHGPLAADQVWHNIDLRKYSDFSMDNVQYSAGNKEEQL